MVRVNLVDPKQLADQHLIAEYNEILMLFGYVRKYPGTANIPDSYRLGKGHITFFKDKLTYLQKRHEKLKEEMRRRGFSPQQTIDLEEFDVALRNDWSPTKKDVLLIKERIAHKIREKPGFYRYKGTPRTEEFFIALLE